MLTSSQATFVKRLDHFFDVCIPIFLYRYTRVDALARRAITLQEMSLHSRFVRQSLATADICSDTFQTPIGYHYANHPAKSVDRVREVVFTNFDISEHTRYTNETPTNIVLSPRWLTRKRRPSSDGLASVFPSLRPLPRWALCHHPGGPILIHTSSINNTIPHPLTIHPEIHDPQLLPERQHHGHHTQLRCQIYPEDHPTRNARICPERHDQRPALRVAVSFWLLRCIQSWRGSCHYTNGRQDCCGWLSRQASGEYIDRRIRKSALKKNMLYMYKEAS